MTSISLGPRIARIASLPGKALDLSFNVTETVLASVRDGIDQHAAAATAVADKLFELIPQADRDTRRPMLAIRRRLHRADLLNPPDVELLESWLPHSLMSELVVAQTRREELTKALETALLADDARGRDLLRAAFSDPAVDDALALLAPSFRQSIIGADLSAGTRLARKALFYASRVALKPTPLSTLAGIRFDEDQPAHRAIQVSPVFAFALLGAFAAHPELRKHMSWLRAGIVDPARPELFARRSVSMADSFGWSSTILTSIDGSSTEVSHLPTRPLSWGELQDLATGVEPETRLGRWIAAGLIRPITPWADQDSEPLECLSGILRASGVHAHAADRLDDTLRALAAVARLSGAERREALVDVRAGLDGLFEQYEVAFTPERLVYEDSVSAYVPEPFDDGRVMKALGRHIRPTMFRSLAYPVIVEKFVNIYGRGGATANAAEFFSTAATDATWASTVHRCWTADTARSSEPGKPYPIEPIGRTSAPPVIAVSYQRSGETGAEIVINQIHDDLGALIARFGSLDQVERPAIGDRIDSWLDECFGKINWLPFVPNSDVNSLQRQSVGKRPNLSWFADYDATGLRRPSLDQVSLHHDDVNDTLEFRGLNGELVAPVYMGVVPAWSLDVAFRLAITVMNPWVDGSALSRDANPYIRQRSIAKSLGAHARRTVDDLVVVRATWNLEGTEFPRPRRDSADAASAYLTAVDRWRTDHGMPAEVFLLSIGADPFNASSRKPVWLDFRSLHGLLAILDHIDGALHIRIQEALPVRASDSSIGDDRAVEYMRLLRWEGVR